MGKHVVVDQKLCDKVWKLYSVDMSRKDIAEFLGIGRSTVDRIVNANFDHSKMISTRITTDMERQAKKRQAEEKQAQIAMDLDEEKKPASYQEALDEYKEEKDLNEYDKKIMRFEAGQVEKICARLDKIYDLLGQVLRRLDDGHTRSIIKGSDQGQTRAEEERNRH